ncbi:GntR family transcriptional regulator [Actinospica sp. MGRD01-02]|uniref:GntR family transcriptional regulator n=1 Tax=Actinospica acidithermotolerans TaxID=2828514 RepID=A0A941EED5_9ACTN|nr:GntR family transcriptional regulator [Actinospica acidithermotolerans]MBR7829832.1 GntR family transcriptional regulator [Actinospica acidithermotolerans]
MDSSLGERFADLERDRHLLGRSSTAERVAAILRDRITVGLLPPGTRLVEEAIGEALGVSRNTLRESFRLLTHERLLVHELNRGVFVRTLSEEDVVELYRVRRMIELAAVRSLATAGEPSAATLAKVAEAVTDAELAAAEDRWQDVGTANLRFHRALVELAGSTRIEEFMAQILAELRLLFHVMKNPRRFHEPYIGRNREILEALEARDLPGAEALLRQYLDDAESQLVEAHTEPPKPAASS